MKLPSNVWYLILLVVLVLVAVSLNELDLGLFSLLLLYPAYTLFERIWGDENPSE
jgi:hypothetical protein